MKSFIIFVFAVAILSSCSKEKTNGIPVKPTDQIPASTPKPIYDTFNLRVAVGDWNFDPWTLLFDGDSTYFTTLPRFSTLPGLTGRADSMNADNFLSVKIKMGTMVLEVDKSIRSRPFVYNMTNQPSGGPHNTIMIHWWVAQPIFHLVDSVYLQLKFSK